MKKSIFLSCFLILFLLISCNSNKKLITANMNTVKSFSFREKRWQNNEGFSIAIIPDSQSYTNMDSQTFNYIPYIIDQWKIYYRQTAFIARNSVINGGDFSFALHVGDHIEHRNWRPFEWELSAICFQNLNGQIPVLAVPGNHDYDRWVGLSNQCEGSNSYNKYYGPQSDFFHDKDWYKGSSKEGRNSWAIFNAAGKDILVIGLELNPDSESILWAQEILNNHKDLPAILLTHAYLSRTQEDNESSDIIQEISIEDNNKSIIPDYKPGVNYKFTESNSRKKRKGWNARKIWEEFVSKNNQIFLVVCGHVGSETRPCGYRIDKNQDGFTTYSIYSNFQDYRNYLKDLGIKYKKKPNACGDGWFSILDIDLENNQIDFSCFNSETGKFLKGPPFEMSFPIDWDWEQRLAQK